MLLHTMPTTMPMAAIFNNKIKSALLILMCALIWQHGPKMCGVDAADNNEDNNNNERGNNAYGMTAAVAALLMSGINDERADSGNGSGRNAAGLQWDKQAEQVAKDQLSEINETLSGYSSDDGDDIKAVEAVAAAAAAAAEKEEEEKEEEKNHNDKTAITVDREDKAGKGSNAIGMADELTTTATTTTTEVLMETTSTATTATTTTEVFIETTSTAATPTTTTTVLTAALTTDAAANVQDHNEAVDANNNNSNNNNNGKAYERTTITQRAMAKASPAAVPDVKAAASAWPDEAETAEAKAADELDPVPLVMTAILQQQLIYEFAIKYKQIPRVTFLTCRSETAAGAASESVDRTMSLNVNTMEILRRMYTAEAESATKTTTTTTTATTTTTIAKPIITTTATTAGNTTATAAGAATKTASLVPRGNGNGNGNGKGNVIGVADTGTVVAAAIAAPAGISDAATNNKNRNNNINNINSNNNNEAKSRFGQTLPRGILIKVVQIDQLINKRRASNGNSNGNNNGHVQRAAGGPAGFGVAYGRAAGGGMGAAAAGRNAYTNANWLEQVLRADTRRQMVVLNLSCGAASRRLLEMASNKALFNSSYHWLLIEDYAFNRQTGIDDSVSDSDSSDDNDDNDNDNDNTNTNTNASNEEVVNGDKRVPTKKLDIVGAATATNERQRQLKARQQQQQSNAAGTDAAADSAGNEDDMEIIEKFLEKINININTELILAKRQRQRQRREEATDGIGVGVGDSVASNATNSNNSLQKKDYYKLYDVWNPGLQYGGQLNISEIGYFALDDGLQIAPWYRRSTTITRRLDMEMARIRCLVVITHKNRTDTLEHYLTTHYDTHLDSMNRFNFALLSHVRDLFNFSFVLSKTSTWGYLKNGKFDGMIGALVRKQADIGGSPIFFRIERAKVIDYTSRTWVARPCFIFRHPRSTKKDRIVFLQPFSNDVWIWLGVCGVATILLLWLLTTLERRLESAQGLGCLRRGSVAAAKSSADSGALVVATTTANAVDGSELGNAPQRKLVPGGGCRRRLLRLGNAFCGQAGDDVAQHRVGLFLESVLFYVGSICQQGLAFSTSFFSGRCIVITSLLFAFSIYQFYSASIVGTLLMEKPKTIRTLRDLIHSSLEIGIEDIVYNRDYFLRTKDPDAIELYAKKVTSVPMTGETFAETPGEGMPPPMAQPPSGEQSAAAKAKTYREILHSHETGAHAKTNEASNWYDPEFGVAKIKKGRFAFHVDVATAYKIIADTYNEKEICDLTEIQLFPPQKMVSIVQKGSPLRKIITYGLRRVTEVGLMDYQRKVWHSPKPRCVKQIHTDDLRVDMQTFMSALLVLIFGYAVSLLALSLEIMHHKLWQRYVDGAAAA